MATISAITRSTISPLLVFPILRMKTYLLRSLTLTQTPPHHHFAFRLARSNSSTAAIRNLEAAEHRNIRNSSAAYNFLIVVVDVAIIQLRPTISCHLSSDVIGCIFNGSNAVLNLHEQPAIFTVSIHMNGGILGVGVAGQQLVAVDLDTVSAINQGAIGICLCLIQFNLDITDGEGVDNLIRAGQVRNRRADGHANEQRRAAYRQKYLAHLVGLPILPGHILVPPSVSFL